MNNTNPICPICQEKFKGVEFLIEHTITIHNKCSECGNTKSLLEQFNARMLVCKTCKTREFISSNGRLLGVIPL